MHQLDAEAVAAEFTYTITNTHPSCSEGGESNRIPNTFKEAIGLPQAARWKAASYKEITSLEKHGVFELVHRFGMKSCNPAYNPGVGPALSLNQPEEKRLNEGDKRRYQAITGAIHIFRMSHLLRHPPCSQPAGERHVQAHERSHGGGQASASLLGRVHGRLHYKQGGFRFAALSHASWGNNPDNDRFTSSDIVMLVNAPIIFKMGMQELTAHSPRWRQSS